MWHPIAAHAAHISIGDKRVQGRTTQKIYCYSTHSTSKGWRWDAYKFTIPGGLRHWVDSTCSHFEKKHIPPSGPIQDSKWVWLFTPCSIPTVIIHFRLGFSIINQPFLGTPWCCASEIFVVPISDLGRSAKSRSGHCWWWAWARWRIPSARGIPGEKKRKRHASYILFVSWRYSIPLNMTSSGDDPPICEVENAPL